MGKYICRYYKHSKYQLPTPSIKEHVLSFSASQTPSSTAFIRTSVSSVIDKKNQFCFVLPKYHPK